MLTPPSLQKRHAICWSRDPALNVPDEPVREGDESDDALAERVKKIRREWTDSIARARETGDWRGLIRPGQQPTTFDMRPMPSETFRSLADALASEKIGVAVALSIAFRSCVRGVDNFGDYKMEFVSDPKFGKLASIELVDALDGIDLGIIAELGNYCLDRAKSPSPK